MLKSLAQQILRQAAEQAKSLEAGVQTVVEVIVPGPLAASKIRWDTATRARAEAAVQRAIRNWREQEQQHGER